PWNRGNICGRQTAHGSDQELSAEGVSSIGCYTPEVRRLVVVRGRHAGVEADAALQIEAVCDEIEITHNFRRAGIALRPFPLAHEFVGERVTIGMTFGIAARARITIPVPGAADAGASFQRLNRQT